MVSNEHSSLQCYSILMRSDPWSRCQRMEPQTKLNQAQELAVSSFQTWFWAIEEPELYQHPSRQRHLASVLLNLAKGAIPGVAENTQVIYATHSPLFVGLDRFGPNSGPTQGAPGRRQPPDYSTQENR